MNQHNKNEFYYKPAIITCEYSNVDLTDHPQYSFDFAPTDFVFLPTHKELITKVKFFTHFIGISEND